MSIKLYGLIPRKAEQTKQEFHDYYRHPHGTMGRGITMMRGYVQNHQIPTTRLGADQERYDAIAEVWLDNEYDALHFREDPVLVKYIVDDEPILTDYERVNYFIGNSEVLISGPLQGAGLHPGDEMWSPANRPLSVKLMIFVDLDGTEDWKSEEAMEIGRKLGAFRQTRATPLESAHRDMPTFLGLHEFWWPTQTVFERSVDAAPGVLEALQKKVGRSWTTLVQAERFM